MKNSKNQCPTWPDPFEERELTPKEERRKLKKEGRRLNQVARLYAITMAYDYFAKKRLYASIANTKNDYKEAEQSANLANFIFHDRGIQAKPTDFIHDVDETVNKAMGLHDKYMHMLELIDEEKFRFAGLNSKAVDAFCRAVEYGQREKSGKYRYPCILLKSFNHVQYPEILAACIAYMSGRINIIQFRYAFQWVTLSMKLEPINIRSFARQMNEILTLYGKIEKKQAGRSQNINE